MPRHTWESRPGTAPPTPPMRPSTPLCDACGMASNNLVALCHPLPYVRCAAPSKKDSGALKGKTNNYAAPAQGQRRDVGLARPVTSVTIGPVRPSSPSPTPSWALHHHPRHLGGTGRQDDATPAAVRPMASHQPHPRVHVRGTTKQASPQRHPRSRSWTDIGHAMTPN
jgi:hypothetical protein